MNDFKNSNYYKYLFTLVFVVFATLTTTLSYFLTDYIFLDSVEKSIETSVKVEIQEKKKSLEKYTDTFENKLLGVAKSKIFTDFISEKSKNNKELALSLFKIIADTQPQVMQVRFLNIIGKEELRVEKSAPNSKAKQASSLLDKGDRDYFQKAFELQEGEVWTSALELNREMKKIETPINPTVRVSTPIYDKNRRVGVLVINYFMKEFLNALVKSSNFHVVLADADGDFIVYKSIDNQHSFTKDLKSSFTLEDLKTNSRLRVVQVDEFSLGFFPKESYITKLNQLKKEILLAVIGVFLVISIPIGIALSMIPIRLHKKFSALNYEQSMLLDIFDKHIYYTDTDKDGKIKNVTKAFLKKMNFSMTEVKGHSQEVFRPHYKDGVTMDTIIEKVNSGNVWQGEVLNESKDGKKLWFDTTIAPKIDPSTGDISAISSIKIDITDKKRVEANSITDELTGLYNRRYYKEVIDREIQRVKRDEKTLIFMMLDIDHFKLYNDTYGHQEGDRVLKLVAQSISNSLSRASDYCFRMGGEEFSVLVSDLGKEDAVLFAKKIIHDIRDLEIQHSKSLTDKYITASLGLIVVNPKHDIIDEDAIYKLADTALYEAKELGRNRVYLHQNDELELF